ncbi:MAG: fumarylacetoacetate hydrolase family protein [Acidimicrobiia bacterium]|nr:fumarylacetoacetate hydrolase family protein [Acidimicrobiia bacterium]
MELVTVRHDGALRAGRIEGDDIVLLRWPTVKELLADDGLAEAATDDGGEVIARAGADLAPIVPRPDKVICVGVNYADHIAEMGRTPPDHPTYFAKYGRALIGANDDIVLPPTEASTSIDWECELALVIGRPVRNAGPEEALAAIAGYCALNDVSVRDWQTRTTQYVAGKTWESTTPVGPALVTTEVLGDGRGLNLSTTVNGVVKQQSSTEHLVFGPLEIVADLSRIMTLDPGDIITTGTPGGVGVARNPQEFLSAGDEVVVEVEGVGRLVNHCVGS